MANHPNRKKVWPSYVLADAAREAGADARLMWEIPGPKDTAIAWISCYAIGQSICIVETFMSGGWNALTPCRSADPDSTLRDVLERCGVPVKSESESA